MSHDINRSNYKDHRRNNEKPETPGIKSKKEKKKPSYKRKRKRKSQELDPNPI